MGLFVVPTSSMEKTILLKSYILVNKFDKKPERNDIYVFRFPMGDTILINQPDLNYYDICRRFGGRNEAIDNREFFGEIEIRSVSEKEYYFKRIVGLPGDELRIDNGILFINERQEDNLSTRQYSYMIQTNGPAINSRIFEKMGVSKFDYSGKFRNGSYFGIPLTDDNVAELKSIQNVVMVEKELVKPNEESVNFFFPNSESYPRSRDFFGPLSIPKEGESIGLSLDNLPLYERIIDVYENNKLEIVNGIILINGSETDQYTFKQDYYFAMGDNRHNSADSRIWGFVPQDHIVGKMFMNFCLFCLCIKCVIRDFLFVA